MKVKFILVSIAALALCAAAQGQDLKPVKDKGSKLFGYQDKSKNWVIEPAYEGAKRFKDGFAEVTCKPGKTKLHGVIDATGRVVIPLECYAVNVYGKEGVIMAERDAEVPGFGLKPMWGVYDTSGGELFAPQFSSCPSWHGGTGIACLAENGMKGVISADGEVLLPFENLAVDRRYGGFSTLTSDFVRISYDGHLAQTGKYAYPGYIRPYDPMGDPVRAAAWQVGPIGRRFYRNSLRDFQEGRNSYGRSAVCSELRIDWAGDRFVRFEPIEDEGEHPGAMLEPVSGKLYTVKAILYEPDGTPVGDLSRWGWFDTEYSEGVVYNTETGERWIALSDLNFPAISSFTTPLSRGRTIDHSDVVTGLGLRSYELDNMHNPSRYADRVNEIIKKENAGISSRLPRPAPDIRTVRKTEEINRLPLFHHRFHLGEVVNCKTRTSDAGVELELSDKLVCHFEDVFDDPSFRMESDAEVFWGPANEYTVQLSAEAVRSSSACTKDDLYGSGSDYIIVIGLYDYRGDFIQTLGTAPGVDFMADGYIVFEKLGIALMTRGNADKRSDGRGDIRKEKAPKVTLNGAARLPATLSALKTASEAASFGPERREQEPRWLDGPGWRDDGRSGRR